MYGEEDMYEVSILYLRCLAVTVNDATAPQVVGHCFNSLFEMRPYGPHFRRALETQFQFSI